MQEVLFKKKRPEISRLTHEDFLKEGKVKMTKTSKAPGRTFYSLLFIPVPLIFILGGVLFFVNQLLFMKTLGLIAACSFFCSIIILSLKESRFYEILRLSNPIKTLSMEFISKMVALWGLSATLWIFIGTVSLLVGTTPLLVSLQRETLEILKEFVENFNKRFP